MALLEVYSPKKNNIKTSNTLRETLKKEAFERKKNILHLVYKYLVENNLHSVAEHLQNETQTGVHYQVCDNVDLEIILNEYQSFYYTKFQKNPKILRKLSEDELNTQIKKEKKPKEKYPQPIKQEKNEENPFQFEIITLKKEAASDISEITTIKPLTDFENCTTEWREMAEQIVKQIVPKDLGTNFEDCIGLSSTIETLKEAVIYPLIYPQLFEITCAWKGVLLYGPPGTGKTLLAKALACESPSTFINVTSSAFISKWRGESEKMVKVLFDVARFYAPCTIFIDEIDALGAATHDSSHEASRRFKSELLTQIDGIVKTSKVFVLASTNAPWCIDNALLRRFEKRIMVPLPNKDSRSQILQYYFHKNSYDFKNQEIEGFVELTKNFSGSDLRSVCKEIEMGVVREKLKQVKRGGKAVGREVTSGDVTDALKKIRPSVGCSDYKKYIEWGYKHGAL